MKFWTLYLPQFYETKENNEWWGEGYTEWTAVRGAVPLYRGHEQPMIPFRHKYYDLSKRETLEWQARLAQKYGIDAFVIFHYWYEGRLLLEKPSEMLVNSPEIPVGYCFCWANHTWTRAWDGKDHQILVAQKYGGKEEWEAHFQYLLPFWKDPRYRRIDGRPVLFIYKAGDIPDGDVRIAYYEKRLHEEGIADGLYVVEYINTFNTRPSLASSQAVYEDEPNFTCRFVISPFGKAKRVVCKMLHITDYQNFDHLWRLLLKKRRRYDGRRIIHGAFAMWDNSPRRGRDSRVIRGATPQKFAANLRKLSTSNRPDGSDIILINAWNEWGEGAMLEPTEQYGFAYLKAIKLAAEAASADGIRKPKPDEEEDIL